MPKGLLFILGLVTILATAYLTLVLNNSSSKLTKTEIETATNQAKHLYRQEKEKGRDFSDGPCLSKALMPSWVVDIAHNPRIGIDDLPQNQCPGFQEGKAKHFVELDPEGNLIRVE